MMLALLIEDMLLDLGHDVVAIAANVQDAAALAREASFDLALLDVNLNGEESFPVAEILLERNIPFLFATAYGSSVLRGRFPGSLVLGKPFKTEDLGHALMQVQESR